jgi:hypothetical protein
LGVTPVSLEIPYGEAHVEYVVHKDGYLPRTTTVIPTISSAVFTILQKNAKPATPAVESEKGSTEARSRPAARRAAALETDGGVAAAPEDEDGVLELSVYR